MDHVSNSRLGSGLSTLAPMRKLTQAFLAAGLVAGLSAPTLADPNETLKVGDAAPALSVAEWVKGEAAELERGQIYLIEFWATW